MRPCRALRVIKLQWLSVGIPSAPLAWPPRRTLAVFNSVLFLVHPDAWDLGHCLRAGQIAMDIDPSTACVPVFDINDLLLLVFAAFALSSHISSLMTALPTLSAVPHCVAHTRPVSTSRVEAYALSVASSNYQTVRYSSNLPSSSSTSVANPHTPNQVSRVLSCTYLQLSSILENFKEGF